MGAALVTAVLLYAVWPGTPVEPPATPPIKAGGDARPRSVGVPSAAPAKAKEPEETLKRVLFFDQPDVRPKNYLELARLTFDGCRPKIWYTSGSWELWDLDGWVMKGSDADPKATARVRLGDREYFVRPSVRDRSWSMQDPSSGFASVNETWPIFHPAHVSALEQLRQAGEEPVMTHMRVQIEPAAATGSRYPFQR